MTMLEQKLKEYSTIKNRLVQILDNTISLYKDANQPQRLQEVELLRASIAVDAVKIAVVGEFKGGKSTLVNAIIGSELLPTWTAECSATITQVRYGSTAELSVHYEDGREETHPIARLKELATVDNPEFLKVRYIDVLHPCAILANGMIIVDTPGINSAVRARESIALNFMNIADAIVLVLNAEFLLTAHEMTFIKREIGPRNFGKVFVAINRCDIFNDQREELQGCIADTLVQVNALIPSVEKLYALSALEALEARQTGDAEVLRTSGVAELEDDMAAYVVKESAEKRLMRIRDATLDNLREYDSEMVLRAESVNLTGEKYKISTTHLETAIAKESASIRNITDEMHSGFMKLQNKLETDLTTKAKTAQIRIESRCMGVEMTPALKSEIQDEIENEVRQWLMYTDKIWHDFYNDVMKWAASELSSVDFELLQATSALLPTAHTSLLSVPLSPVRLSIKTVTREVTEYTDEKQEAVPASKQKTGTAISGLGIGLLAAGFIVSGGVGAILAIAGGLTLFSNIGDTGGESQALTTVRRPIKRLLEEHRMDSLSSVFNMITQEIMVKISEMLRAALSDLTGQVEKITHGYFAGMSRKLDELNRDRQASNVGVLREELSSRHTRTEALIGELTSI